MVVFKTFAMLGLVFRMSALRGEVQDGMLEMEAEAKVSVHTGLRYVVVC